MKTFSAFFLSLVVAGLQVEGGLGICTMDKVIEDVAVNVVSEAATILLSNKVNMKGLPYCQPRDCATVQHGGQNRSGVYRVWPLNGDRCGILVYCDLEQDNGGWTVIQRRGDFGNPEDYFDKQWRDYKFGFGNISEDFWIGNDIMFQISNQDNYIMRVDLQAHDGESKYAVYDQFFIDSESNNYTLHITGYSGNAGDSLRNHTSLRFTTNDVDNDRFKGNCAIKFKGGWWYHRCYDANLNGIYRKESQEKKVDGINWEHFNGIHYSQKEVSMKIRPKWY